MRNQHENRQFYLPHIGQRIVKTSIAVFITLLVYYLRGYRGADMPAEAAITAIICMQPYVRDTRDYALSRLGGTLLGTVCALPMAAKKIGFDPAVMASPFITTIVDALSLLVYFGIASALLF